VSNLQDAGERGDLIGVLPRVGLDPSREGDAFRKGLAAIAASAVAAVQAADGAAVEIIEGGACVYVAVSGRLEPFLGRQISRAASLSGACMNQKEAMISADAFVDPRVDKEAARAVDARSLLVAPILRGGEAIGVLKLASTKPDAFGEDDLPLARVLGDAVAGVFAERERRRSEDLQAATERWLDAVLSSAPVGIVIADASGRIIAGNRRAEEIFGHPVLYSRDIGAYTEWVGYHADGRKLQSHEYPLARVIDGGEERPEAEMNYQRGDGRLAWVRIIGAPVRDRAGQLLGAVVTILDIDRQKTTDATLRRLNVNLAEEVTRRTHERDRIWQVSEDLLGVADLEGRWVSVNPAWTRALGWSERELLGRTSEWLEHPDDRETTRAEVARLAEGFTTLNFENRFRHRDGEYRTLSWTAVKADGSLYTVARDVTAERARAAELAATQDALRQAQKMEAIGQLTGGLAHDFNNLLTGVISGLSVIRRRLPGDASPQIGAVMDAVVASANRAAGLVHRLLAFSRRQSLDMRAVTLAELIASMESLARRTLGESISLSVDLPEDLWPVAGDASQIETALLNFVINARDAMPDGGALTVAARNVTIVNPQRDLAPGEYVGLFVTDTGEGMRPDVVARAVDPFFTTKPIGKGTGLGLSMAFGYAKQAGGALQIESELGQGTTISLFMPRSVAAPEAAAASADAIQRGDGLSVLVVEDDPSVRRTTVELLGDLGYACAVAEDGTRGLAMVEGGEKFDILVTDVGLPGLNGRELAARARALRPGLKVLFVTGYEQNEADRTTELGAGTSLLMKPFSEQALASALHDLAGRRG
jgi:PAS domain S-box-containing protein